MDDQEESKRFEAWYASLGEAEQERVYRQLKQAAYDLLSSSLPKRHWQMTRAAFLGVKLTEFDRN